MKSSFGNLTSSPPAEPPPLLLKNAGHEWREVVLPLAAWQAVQLVALGLAVFEFPLATGAAGYPRPATLLAAYLIADTQIIVGSLFFPTLFRSWRASILAIAATLPFMAAGGFFSGLDFATTLTAAAYACGWLASLAWWRTVLNSDAGRLTGGALAGTFAAGGAALAYLRLDFNFPPRPTEAISQLFFGPVIGVNAIFSGESHGISAFSGPFANLALAASVTLARFLLRRRRKLAA